MKERHLEEIRSHNAGLPPLADADLPAGVAVRLSDDNARLRALIKQAEWSSDDVGHDACCPWCGRYFGLDRDGNGKQAKAGEHAGVCPAFTPKGEVK